MKKARSVIDARTGPAPEEFKLFGHGCKPKWPRQQLEAMEPF